MLAMPWFMASAFMLLRAAQECKAKAALFKGGIMAAFGFFALGQAVYKIVFPRFQYSRPLAPLACWLLQRTAFVWLYSGGIEPKTLI